jgi:hypothetical protein
MEIHARCNPASAPARCSQLWDLMKDLDVTRNVYTYSVRQNVMARSGLPNATQQTMDLLQEMLDEYKQQRMDEKGNRPISSGSSSSSNNNNSGTSSWIKPNTLNFNVSVAMNR